MKDTCRTLETTVMQIFNSYGGDLETKLNKVDLYSFGVVSIIFFGCGDTLIFVCE
jgi:hypothetical protein